VFQARLLNVPLVMLRETRLQLKSAIARLERLPSNRISTSTLLLKSNCIWKPPQ